MKLYILVPRLAQRLLNLIIPLFSPKTQGITHIFSDKSEWKPVLLQTIRPDQLPVLFGTDESESEP